MRGPSAARPGGARAGAPPPPPRGRSDGLEALRALSEAFGVPGIDLGQLVIDAATLRLLPRALALRAKLLPFTLGDREVHVALVDPSERRIVDEIEFATGRSVRAYVAVPAQLERVLADAHRAIDEGATHYVGPRAPRDYLVSLGLAAPEPAPPPAVDDSVSVPAPHVRSAALPLDPAFGSRIAPLPTFRSGTSPQPKAAERTVLVVDPDGETRAALRRGLEAAGYVVIEAERGTEALQRMRDHAPDVVLLEAVVPELSGFELCRRIRASRRFGTTPVVMTRSTRSEWGAEDDARDALAVHRILEKPLSTADVVAALAGAVDRTLTPPAEAMSDAAQEALTAGIEAYRAGDLATAIARVEHGVALDPRAHRLRYHLGLLYGRADDVFGAMRELETAIGLAPRHFPSLKNLAVIYEQAGFSRRALATWVRALDAAPDAETRRGIQEHLVMLLQQR